MRKKIYYIINMKKTFLFAIIFLMAMCSTFALAKKEFRIVLEAIPQEQTYVMYIEDLDWGAGISKLSAFFSLTGNSYLILLWTFLIPASNSKSLM